MNMRNFLFLIVFALFGLPFLFIPRMNYQSTSVAVANPKTLPPITVMSEDTKPQIKKPAFHFNYNQPVKGIYITQTTLEDTAYITYLIQNAKNSGINTFVVDMDKPGKRYQKNIALVTQSGLNYVARVVMFPGGGTTEQINTEKFWQRKLPLIQAAINYGAKEIQLDYIRYDTKRAASEQHAKDIHKIISWYKQQLPSHIPLQIDVFGISSYGPENHIGQNVKLFADTIDVLCPMVYPSHYQPFAKHFETPYETVYDSLHLIKKQFNGEMPIKLVAYIELSNYHYPLSQNKKVAYIQAQLQAVKDANADGWYAWSPNNKYDTLFEVLSNQG